MPKTELNATQNQNKSKLSVVRRKTASAQGDVTFLTVAQWFFLAVFALSLIHI